LGGESSLDERPRGRDEHGSGLDRTAIFFFHNWSTGLDRTEKIYVVLM